MWVLPVSVFFWGLPLGGVALGGGMVPSLFWGGNEICRAFFSRAPPRRRSGKWLRNPGRGDGDRRPDALVRHELRNPALGMEGREETARFTLVSTGIRHLLVRGTSSCSHDLCRNGNLRRFRAKRIFLASPRYFVPFAEAGVFRRVRGDAGVPAAKSPSQDDLTCDWPSSHPLF